MSTVACKRVCQQRKLQLFALHRRDEEGTAYYVLEYTARGATWFRHNLSVYAVRCVAWPCLLWLSVVLFGGLPRFISVHVTGLVSQARVPWRPKLCVL